MTSRTASREEVSKLLRNKGMCGHISEDEEGDEDPRSGASACILEIGHDDGEHESYDERSTEEILAVLRGFLFRGYHPVTKDSTEAKAFYAIERRMRAAEVTPIVATKDLAAWQRKLGEACSEDEWSGVTNVIESLDEVVRVRTRAERDPASVAKIKVEPAPAVVSAVTQDNAGFSEGFIVDASERTKVGFR